LPEASNLSAKKTFEDLKLVCIFSQIGNPHRSEGEKVMKVIHMKILEIPRHV
jgi:hypothetical protein